MFPIIPSTMKYQTGSSAAYPGSSPYAVPSQPPFAELTRTSRRPSVSSRQPRSFSSSTSNNSRKSSLFSLRSNSSSDSRSNLRRSSSSLLTHYNTADSVDGKSLSSNSNASLGTSIKSMFSRDHSSREEKAVRKAEKERARKVAQAEREAYERAQDMEASALYMAWSMF